MIEHGMITWSELMTTEPDKAKAFYEKSLGVSFDTFGDPDGKYWVAMAGGKPAWGLMDMRGRPDAGPASWVTYIAVDDVDKRAAAAEKAGAKLMAPIFDIPTVGRIAMLQDGSGAMVGWMTPVPTA